MKTLSLFSGIGAFERGFENAGLNVELVNYCEFDKYASKAYSLIHNVPESMNMGDITKVNIAELEEGCAEVITYGFPCQDISVAGKQRGFKAICKNCNNEINISGEYKGLGESNKIICPVCGVEMTTTRSGLFFYAASIIGKVQPKVAICENVKALTSKKFTEEFKTVLSTLEEMGYTNYWQVLNAKDYGIPQNRERVFIVSVRNDIDKKYVFPTPIKLELRLKDILEHEVDEKYYLRDKQIKTLKPHYEDIHMVNENYGMLDGGIIGKMHEESRRFYNTEYIAPTLHTCGGGNLEPKIIVAGNTKSGGQRSEILSTSGISSCLSTTDYKRPKQIVEPFIVASRGRNPENPSDRTTGAPTEQRLEPNTKGLCNTLTSVQKDNYVVDQLYRIRKLTPKECWRLMGFEDADIDKCIDAKISNTQLYKMAGNSIVTNVIKAIAEQLKECGIIEQ